MPLIVQSIANVNDETARHTRPCALERRNKVNLFSLRQLMGERPKGPRRERLVGQ